MHHPTGLVLYLAKWEHFVLINTKNQNLAFDLRRKSKSQRNAIYVGI